MRATVGTRDWALKGGALTRSDQARLMAQAMLSRLAQVPGRIRHALGIADAEVARIDPSAIRFPDSIAAHEALALSRCSSEPWIVNHSLRTYVWGAMFAQKERMVFDHELLFVASALHDLGLTHDHGGRDPGCACFAVESARAAERFAARMDWTNERRERLSAAISLHLNVRVGMEHGAEAHLLHEGAALDVIGARYRQIHRDAVRAVLCAHPRLDFKEAMSASMKAQAAFRPQSRAAFLVRMGFIGMIHAAPCPDSAPALR